MSSESSKTTWARPALPRAWGLAGLLLAGSFLLPVAYLAVRALEAENFLDLLVRAQTGKVLLNTVLLAAAVTATAAALSLPAAWLTTRTDLPARRLWTILLVLPLAVPSYVGGFAVIAALGPRGLVQQALAPLGVERLPPIYGFAGAWLTLSLFTYPYLLLTLRSALLGLSPSYEEAARSLGHSPWSAFVRAVLPRLIPPLAAGGLLIVLYTIADFGAVSLLQFDTFSRAIYVQYKSSFDRNLAAALALVVVVLTIFVLAFEARVRRLGREAESASAKAPPRSQPLGSWKIPALVFCGALVLLGVGLPGVTIGYWLGNGLSQGETVGPLMRPLLNSLGVSAAAALLCVAAAIPVGVLSVRHAGFISGLIERSVYTGHALPPVATAFALVFFAANYVPWVYQSITLLIFAYMLRFTPQAVAALRPRLLQLSPELEQAARSLGRSPRRVLIEITLPLVRPGLLAGGALAFLTTMKELPATLLLSPTGFATLATQSWAATSEAFFARSAASALTLLVFSSLSLLLLLRMELER